MDFEGISYKTTLRAPDANGMKRYVFNLSDMAANGKAPKYASVAPIFLERGRSFVGDITSNALMPYAKIVLNITQLVIEIGQDEGDGDFIIVLDNDVLELDYDVCNPSSPVEDPWGGCAFHSSALAEAFENGATYWANITTWNSEFNTGTQSLKFSGTDNCVVGENICVSSSDFSGISPVGLLSFVTDLVLTTTSGSPGSGVPCTNAKVYVYDSTDCG